MRRDDHPDDQLHQQKPPDRDQVGERHVIAQPVPPAAHGPPQPAYDMASVPGRCQAPPVPRLAPPPCIRRPFCSMRREGVLPEPMQAGRDAQRPASYAAAGVDIDAGNALVEGSSRWRATTRRPGVVAELGGFGALFDLRAAGYRDPVLVAATDGVGTKLKIAIDTGIHETIGIDLVAMCVNDLVVQGAEPLFFLDYFATGQLDPPPAPSSSPASPRAAGSPARADRRRDRRDARDVRRRRLRPRRLRRRRGRARPALAAPRHRGRRLLLASPRPACTPTAIRWFAGSSPTPARPRPAGAVRRRRLARRRCSRRPGSTSGAAASSAPPARSRRWPTSPAAA